MENEGRKPIWKALQEVIEEEKAKGNGFHSVSFEVQVTHGFCNGKHNIKTISMIMDGPYVGVY